MKQPTKKQDYYGLIMELWKRISSDKDKEDLLWFYWQHRDELTEDQREKVDKLFRRPLSKDNLGFLKWLSKRGTDDEYLEKVRLAIELGITKIIE